MKRFKNILVVFSEIVGDDDTLAQATALAKRNNARLTAVEVINDLDLPSNAIAEKEKILHRLTTSIQQDGITLDTVVLRGTPFLEIIRQVLREKHDLVMITAQSRSVVREFFLDNTAMRLMRKCPCAVWAVNPRGHNNYARVLAAVDPRPDDEEAEKLNIKIMDLAISQASLNNSELHLAHVWKVTGPDLETLRSEPAVLGSEGTHEEILNRHESMHRKILERYLGRYDLAGLKFHIHLPQGDPGVKISQIADEQQIDLIVMGTVVRTGIPGFFIGNTAENIVRMVNCSVMAVKPEGFVTPVTLEVQ